MISQKCSFGQSGIVKLLIAAGADVTITDKHGKMAFMWALNEGRSDVVELLQNENS